MEYGVLGLLLTYVSDTSPGPWNVEYASVPSLPATLSITFAPPGCSARKLVTSQTVLSIATQQESRVLFWVSWSAVMVAIVDFGRCDVVLFKGELREAIIWVG